MAIAYTLYPIPCLYASFSDIPGLRNSALGNSGVASISDITAGPINPAGLAYIRGKEFVFEYRKPFLGTHSPDFNVPGYYELNISKGFSGFGLPLPRNIGSFSFYYSGLSAENLYSESTYAFCYARTLEEVFLREKEEEFSYGIALKYLTVQYQPDEYTEEFFEKYGDDSSGFSTDLGLRYSPSRGLDFGLSLINVLSSDLGLLYENKPEKRLFFGSAYRLNDWFKLSSAYSQKSSYPNQNLHFGSEVDCVKEVLTARLGANKNEMSLGFGFKFKGETNFFRLDYTFLLPFHLKDSYGSHGMSLLFEIPPLVKEKAEVPEVKPAVPEVKPEIPLVVPEIPDVKPAVPEVKPVVKPVPVIAAPKKVDVKEIMRKHYNKGLWHLQRGEDESAIKEFESILKYESNHKPSLIRIKAAKKRVEEKRKKIKIRHHWARGVEFFRQKQYNNARYEFMQVLKLEPGHKSSLIRLKMIEDMK